MELGVGEALVSFLDEAGIPSIVERAWILPPQSANGVIEPQILQTLILSDEFEEKYRESYDRESAYEIILAANEELEAQRAVEAEAEKAEKARLKEEAAQRKAEERKAALAQREAEKNQKTLQRAANAATASVARSVSTNLVNSMLGGRQTSTKTIVKRAAASALSSVMRNGSSSIIRGLLGNIK